MEKGIECKLLMVDFDAILRPYFIADKSQTHCDCLCTCVVALSVLIKCLID